MDTNVVRVHYVCQGESCGGVTPLQWHPSGNSLSSEVRGCDRSRQVPAFAQNRSPVRCCAHVCPLCSPSPPTLAWWLRPAHGPREMGPAGLIRGEWRNNGRPECFVKGAFKCVTHLGFALSGQDQHFRSLLAYVIPTWVGRFAMSSGRTTSLSPEVVRGVWTMRRLGPVSARSLTKKIEKFGADTRDGDGRRQDSYPTPRRGSFLSLPRLESALT
jgi:hypothetical protein